MKSGRPNTYMLIYKYDKCPIILYDQFTCNKCCTIIPPAMLL